MKPDDKRKLRIRKLEKENSDTTVVHCVLIPTEDGLVLAILPNPKAFFRLCITQKNQLILDPLLLSH